MIGIIILLLGLAGLSGAAAEGDSLAERVRRICADFPLKVTAAFCDMEAAAIRLVGPNGERVMIDVLVADDDRRRQAGYQFIAGEVVQESAIFFVFDAPVSTSFHMCNVLVPLEIVWFRANGTVLDAVTMRPGGVGDPARCVQTYGPRRFGTFRFALELPAGGIDQLGITALDQWRLDVAPWDLGSRR